MRALTLLAISATLVMSASACGPAVADPTPTPTAPAPSPTVASTSALVPPVASPSSGSGSGSGSGLNSSSANAAAQTAVVEAVMRDAAGRLSLASGAGDLHVQQVEARDWPDSALGCPTPGVMYAQVVTPGYLVIVSGAGRELEYHADERGRLVLCQEV